MDIQGKMMLKKLDKLFADTTGRTELACMVLTEEDWDGDTVPSPYEALDTILKHGGETMLVPIEPGYAKLLVFPWVPSKSPMYKEIDKLVRNRDLHGYCSAVCPASRIKVTDQLDLLLCNDCLTVDLVAYEEQRVPLYGTDHEQLIDVLTANYPGSFDQPVLRAVCTQCHDTWGGDDDGYEFSECLHRVQPGQWRLLQEYIRKFTAAGVTDF